MSNWDCDDTKTEEYGQYVYYNTMADWLYIDNNFEKYKQYLFTQVEYDVNNKKYLSSNCFFDIFSIDFIQKMIKMLELERIKESITKSKDYTKSDVVTLIHTIIVRCAIYILTKIELKPDNIYPPNEQIKISNDLDNQFDEAVNIVYRFLIDEITIRDKNEVENVRPLQDVAKGEEEGDYHIRKKQIVEEDNESDEGYTSAESPYPYSDREGGFSKKKIFRKNTNKKRTIRKKTNKKRTIRKKTNKKRTIRKKIRHTIFKTIKNHK